MTAHQRIGRTLPIWPENLPCNDKMPMFYPEPNQGQPKPNYENPAKLLCRVCPIRTWCGEYAISTKDAFGIWGGMTGKERRMERKRRRDAGLQEFTPFETIIAGIEASRTIDTGESAA